MSQQHDWARERAAAQLTASAETKRATLSECLSDIVSAATVMADALRAGGKVLLCGNGGSAADCQHMAGELVGRFAKDVRRPALAALALTTDTSFITAQANDESFDSIFERQVQALGRAGDVLVAISTSGRSANVLAAASAAREVGMRVIALTSKGASLATVSDVAICVPSVDTQRIQEAHLAIEHVLCDLTEQTLFGDNWSVPPTESSR